MNDRSGGVSLAFLLGILGAVLVVAGALLPQLSVAGHVTAPLFDPVGLLTDPIAATGEAGLAVIVFALFAIAFCLAGRYRWLMFCAVMIVLFLAVALTRQLSTMLGLTIPQIVDMYNGVLPPDVDPAALLAKLPVLQATTYDDGLLAVGAGLLLIELAPWLRRFTIGRGRRKPRAEAEERREPAAVSRSATAIPHLEPPPDLLHDELYIFADGLDQPLTFSLLEPTGRITRHRMRMEAAGYLGDAYYVRCRDLDAGNLRDVPAHLMSDIVDDLTGQPIDTDDLLGDLARVAYEAVADVMAEDGEPGERHSASNAAPTDPAHESASGPVFAVEIPSPEPEETDSGPRNAG